MIHADDRVAVLLRTSAEPLPASEIAARLRLSEDEVARLLHTLQAAGAPLVAVPHVGWQLQGGPLFAGELEALREAHSLGKATHVLRSTRSTNDLALRAGLEGAPHGSVFLAEAQLGGRGRQGRTWMAMPGENLLFSVLLRPHTPTAHWNRLATATALAVAETVDDFCRQKCQIKWPNDVLLGGRKLCGILLEGRTSSAETGFVVAGIGLNVNQTKFPTELETIATSMQIETGREYDRMLVLAALLERLETLAGRIDAHFPAIVEQAWLRSSLAGKTVEIQTGSEVISCRALGMDDDGGLQVCDAAGKERSFLTGEVVRVRSVEAAST